MQGSPMQGSPMQSGIQSGMQKGGRGASKADGLPPIAERDKKLLNLQQQADDKKKQMKEDYKQIKESVKENPYLQAALLQYEEYFALQEKQIKALKALLKDSVIKNKDQMEIKREIADLEKNLP
jgi:predicted RNase H-like nuclease (RuvC/YqgF family)